MQGSKKDPVIKKYRSEHYQCTKCGNWLVWWRTKSKKLVYECETCGWAQVEEE
jgi:predicted RNA-binding Zn-ribbon protein involved in translation (DUF1610 family)